MPSAGSCAVFLSSEFLDLRKFCFSHWADRLVGPVVVALAEQNAIGLAPAVVASSHTSKETFRGIGAEGQTEAP